MQPFLVDVLARKDHANEVLSMTEALDIIQYFLTKISCKQVYNCFKITVLPNSKSVLKSTPVVEQSNTTKRSFIILVQHFLWFKCYNSALDRLQQLSKVLCNLMGKTFGEFIQNLVYGGEKT